jgi:predicted adenylyl cyclase CyaB
LELKARDRDPVQSLEVCRSLGARDSGTLIQRDTYFEVSHGRLKLREEPDAEAQLIAYERPDRPQQKTSRYRLIEIRDSDELKEALAAVLGITVVVEKARHLFIFKGVRIHLDRVDGLGTFIEFEGVAADGDDPGAFELLLVDLRRKFAISDEDLLSESYSDLLRSMAT